VRNEISRVYDSISADDYFPWRKVGW